MSLKICNLAFEEASTTNERFKAHQNSKFNENSKWLAKIVSRSNNNSNNFCSQANSVATNELDENFREATLNFDGKMSDVSFHDYPNNTSKKVSADNLADILEYNLSLNEHKLRKIDLDDYGEKLSGDRLNNNNVETDALNPDIESTSLDYKANENLMSDLNLGRRDEIEKDEKLINTEQLQQLNILSAKNLSKINREHLNRQNDGVSNLSGIEKNYSVNLNDDSIRTDTKFELMNYNEAKYNDIESDDKTPLKINYDYIEISYKPRDQEQNSNLLDQNQQPRFIETELVNCEQRHQASKKDCKRTNRVELKDISVVNETVESIKKNDKISLRKIFDNNFVPDCVPTHEEIGDDNGLSLSKFELTNDYLDQDYLSVNMFNSSKVNENELSVTNEKTKSRIKNLKTKITRQKLRPCVDEEDDKLTQKVTKVTFCNETVVYVPDISFRSSTTIYDGDETHLIINGSHQEIHKADSEIMKEIGKLNCTFENETKTVYNGINHPFQPDNQKIYSFQNEITKINRKSQEVIVNNSKQEFYNKNNLSSKYNDDLIHANYEVDKANDNQKLRDTNHDKILAGRDTLNNESEYEPDYVDRSADKEENASHGMDKKFEQIYYEAGELSCGSLPNKYHQDVNYHYQESIYGEGNNADLSLRTNKINNKINRFHQRCEESDTQNNSAADSNDCSDFRLQYSYSIGNEHVEENAAFDGSLKLTPDTTPKDQVRNKDESGKLRNICWESCSNQDDSSRNSLQNSHRLKSSVTSTSFPCSLPSTSSAPTTPDSYFEQNNKWQHKSTLPTITTKTFKMENGKIEEEVEIKLLRQRYSSFKPASCDLRIKPNSYKLNNKKIRLREATEETKEETRAVESSSSNCNNLKNRKKKKVPTATLR